MAGGLAQHRDKCQMCTCGEGSLDACATWSSNGPQQCGARPWQPWHTLTQSAAPVRSWRRAGLMHRSVSWASADWGQAEPLMMSSITCTLAGRMLLDCCAHCWELHTHVCLWAAAPPQWSPHPCFLLAVQLVMLFTVLGVALVQALLLRHRLPRLLWPCALLMLGGSAMVLGPTIGSSVSRAAAVRCVLPACLVAHLLLCPPVTCSFIIECTPLSFREAFPV